MFSQRIHVIQSFLKIRWLQFGRMLNEVGLVRIVVLLLFFLPLAASIPNLVAKMPWLASIVCFAFVFTIHMNRKDKNFLNLYFDRFAKQIFLVEYFLLGMPLTVLLIYNLHTGPALALLLGSFALSHIKTTIRKVNFHFRRIPLLPAKTFELKAGLRTNYVGILMCLILGVVFTKTVFAPLLSICVLTIILASFNLFCESTLMVQLFRKSPNQLLLEKIGAQSVFMFLLFLPINGAFLLCHMQYWYLLVAVNMVAFTIQSLSICFKYAMFMPGEELKGNNMLIGLAIACFFIVFFAPVPFLMLVLYYNKALKNLKRFVYVRN